MSCFDLLEVPDGEGFTVLERFKECLVSCQSQSSKLTLYFSVFIVLPHKENTMIFSLTEIFDIYLYYIRHQLLFL